VIAARTGGIPGIVKDNETGLLVDSGDEDGLRARMELLIADREKSRRLAAAAFELVTMKYSRKRMCEAYWEVYQEVLGDRQGSHQPTSR
jgi:L-malate glycosyltransferase